MGAKWLLTSGVVAFAFFWTIGHHAHLFRGLDHWCTGHQMLLAESYLRAGFDTPLGLPTEDPYGPVGGPAPYTGQPPLLVVVLASLLAVTGEGLAAARVFACLISAVSAVLVMWLAWRVTRRRWAALLALVIFAGHPMVAKYCSFVCNDTPGLTWSLLLICLYPGLVARGSGRGLALYCLLAAVGGLISWHCYIVPVVCGLALAVADRRLLRACWRRALAPLAAVFLVGLALVGASDYMTRHYVSNESRPYGSAPMAGKFLARTGLNDPGQAYRIVYQQIDRTVDASALPVMGLFLVMAANFLLGRRGFARRQAADRRDAGAADEFYLHALWMLPAVWVLFMPQMHEHEYQMIFFVPFLAVLGALLIRSSLPALAGKHLRAAYVGAVLLGFVAIAWVTGRQTCAARLDSVIYAQLEKDIRGDKGVPGLTGAQTVVVLADRDRGVWWRIRRPVIDVARLGRVRGRDHVLVVPLGTTGWEGDYAVLRRRGFGKSHDTGYLILEPRRSTDPGMMARDEVKLAFPRPNQWGGDQ
jgi:hypothetical protein